MVWRFGDGVALVPLVFAAAGECYVCGDPAPLLCDGKGCDKPICRKHATSAGPEVDHCPRCECARSGHVGLEERRGAPVTEFMVCGRCGKIGERLPPQPDHV